MEQSFNYSNNSHHGLALPQDIDLPYFAYGALKPGEPAYEQISCYLSQPPIPASIKSTLRIRDGLPLLVLGGESSIQGYLFYFLPEQARVAYEAICRFEPMAHYKWQVTNLQLPSSKTNVLVGKKINKGRAKTFEGETWHACDDPVFRYGLKVVRQKSNMMTDDSFISAPPEHFEWTRFFELQMAYLLLWSAIERYSAFLIGPSLEPMERIKKLGQNKRFERAFMRAQIGRCDVVTDSRDASSRKQLIKDDPNASILYYYQVRSNLSHRGKGAWTDGEIVRRSLLELTTIFEFVLEDKL